MLIEPKAGRFRLHPRTRPRPIILSRQLACRKASGRTSRTHSRRFPARPLTVRGPRLATVSRQFAAAVKMHRSPGGGATVPAAGVFDKNQTPSHTAATRGEFPKTQYSIRNDTATPQLRRILTVRCDAANILAVAAKQAWHELLGVAGLLPTAVFAPAKILQGWQLESMHEQHTTRSNRKSLGKLTTN